MKKAAVIICAAGASSRFGGDRKKPFVDVAGRPAFLRSIDFFAGRQDVVQILLAIPPEEQEMVEIKWGAALGFNAVKLCHGGAERFETVANALKKVSPEAELIAVHDAVRCCLTAEWLDALMAKAAQTGAAMLACPVTATLKKVQDGRIIDTVDRTGLYEAQTPQVFDAKLLKDAYAKLGMLGESSSPGPARPAKDKPDSVGTAHPTQGESSSSDRPAAKITDDAMLVEAMGHPVYIVETDHSNIKITRKSDIPIAEAIIKSRPKPKPEGPLGPFVEAQW